MQTHIQTNPGNSYIPINPWLDAKPIDYIVKGNFRVRNYGETHFFPKQSLREGLKEVIIFKENNKKYEIPNGSVWVYDRSRGYIPEILREDVGCGITGYIIEQLNYSPKDVREILKSIRDTGIRIGRGNHFIDFCTAHPKATDSNMLFLHSDFHFDHKHPISFEGAKAMEQESKDRRRESIEKIIKGLDIKGEFYNDWTHNTVEVGEEQTIYRKGAINIQSSNGEGILALNPFEGFFFYASKWGNYHGSMQHGTGKKAAKKFDKSKLEIIRTGNVEGLVIDRTNMPEDVHKYYNEFNAFYETFCKEQLSIGYSRPKLVVYTG
jgi:hypothetical protein